MLFKNIQRVKTKKLQDTRYMIRVDWDCGVKTLDFDFWCSDDLRSLLNEVSEAQKRGFNARIGSCPNLTLTKVYDYQNDKIYRTKKQIKKLRRTYNANTI